MGALVALLQSLKVNFGDDSIHARHCSEDHD